jgi:CelD/BcsL family acetyltransferase involved in cellulose biosynthesis
VLTWLARRQTSYAGGLFHPTAATLLDGRATARLLERIATLVPEADALVLPDQRDDDELNPFRRLARVRGAGIGHSVTLAPWGVLYAARGNRRTRHNDRRREKRLAELAPWQARIAQDPDDRARLMEIMFQHKRIWMRERGIEDFLADEKNRALLLAAASALPASDVDPVVACLEVAGETVAVSFGLSHGAQHYSLITSVHPDEAYRPYTPGEILFRHVLKYACDQDMESFDLGIGTTLQKEQYADRQFRLFHTLVPLTVQGRVYVAALGAQLAVKRLIKETPVIWELFQRLRLLRAGVPGRSGGSAAGEPS